MRTAHARSRHHLPLTAVYAVISHANTWQLYILAQPLLEQHANISLRGLSISLRDKDKVRHYTNDITQTTQSNRN